ncbi:MAG: lysophospholipid acyltransferase family protein [Desulfatibacillaceae bacterium]|nr:lysophospholipid acyltransferase family protein [Desulfatibacillaceae bacterium]
MKTGPRLSMSQQLLYRLFRLGLALLAIIPRSVLVRLANPLSRLWWLLDKRHRDIAGDNLAKAYPDKNIIWINRTAKAVFRHLAIVALEMPSLLRINKDKLDSVVRVEGLENLQKLLAQDRGYFFLTGHFGNWELMAIAASLFLEKPLFVMGRAMDMPAFDRLLTEMRSRTGNQVIDKDNSASLVSRIVRQGGAVGILLDQNAYYTEGLYLDFFGRVACTNKGLALLAIRHNALVAPVFSFREPDGRYRVEFHEPMEMERTGDLRSDVETNTIRFNQVLENTIRRAPEQWLWVHRRWRIMPVPENMRHKLKNYPGPDS